MTILKKGGRNEKEKGHTLFQRNEWSQEPCFSLAMGEETEDRN